MKYLKIFEDFNKNYISGLLNFEITEKAKKWFESAPLSDIGEPMTLYALGTYKIDKVVKLEYFFQKFPVAITNTSDKLRIDFDRSQRNMRDLVFSSKNRKEYINISSALANASYQAGNFIGSESLSGLFLDTTQTKYGIVIGKGSFEYSEHKEDYYKPKFNYYATVGVSIQDEILIFEPRIIITTGGPGTGDDMEIIDVLTEIWGGGNQINTTFEIDYNKLVNKEKYEDKHGWFRLYEVEIQQLGYKY